MRIILLIMVCFGLAACSTPKVDSAAAAKSAFESYVAAINDGDIARAASFYDDGPGFHWIERGGVQYTKGAEAAASLKQLAAGGGKSSMTIDHVQVAPMSATAALVSAHFDFAMLDASGSKEFGFDGWMTVGMVERNGGWKIAGGQTGPGKAAP